MNKKLTNAIAGYLSAFMLGNSVAPLVAAAKSDKLREIYASGALSQRMSFHGNGYTLAGDQLIVAGPVRFTNLGTYAGKSAAFKVLYNQNEWANARSKILKAARDANPHFNHKDLELLISSGAPTEMEAGALQNAFGPADSLAQSYEITGPELANILVKMKNAGADERTFIIRYHSGKDYNGESGLGYLTFNKNVTLDWLKGDKPKQQDARVPIVSSSGKKKSKWPWIILATAAAVAAKAFYDAGKNNADHPSQPQNGTMKGGDTF